MNAFEAFYTDNDNGQLPLGWCACLNVVFAISHLFRATTVQNTQSDSQARGYLQNALDMVPELTMSRPELFSVQAILGMAIVLQMQPAHRPSSFLVSTAMRLAQNLELHQKYQGVGLSASQIEERKRVFWLVYIFDKEMSLWTRDPPIQDDEDMDVDFPAEAVQSNSITSVNHGHLFNCRIKLAMIQGQIYRKLLTTKARKQPASERLLAGNELSKLLDTWHLTRPSNMVDLHSGDSLSVVDPSATLHETVLQFSYSHTLSAICRLLETGIYSQQLIKSDESNPTCVVEARNSLRLLPLLIQQGNAYIWLHRCHLLAAFEVLMHLAANSAHASVADDIKLTQPALELMEVSESEQSSEAERAGATTETLKRLWHEASQLAVGVIDIDFANAGMDLDYETTDQNGPSSGGALKGIQSVADFRKRIEELSVDKCKIFHEEQAIS